MRMAGLAAALEPVASLDLAEWAASAGPAGTERAAMDLAATAQETHPVEPATAGDQVET